MRKRKHTKRRSYRRNRAHIIRSLKRYSRKATHRRTKRNYGYGEKIFNEKFNIGKSKYVVSFHNGSNWHKDGSEFFDTRIFSNKRKKDAFIKSLIKQGYREATYRD